MGEVRLQLDGSLCKAAHLEWRQVRVAHGSGSCFAPRQARVLIRSNSPCRHTDEISHSTIRTELARKACTRSAFTAALTPASSRVPCLPPSRTAPILYTAWA